MKKLLILVPVLLVAMTGGAVWWKYGRNGDPFAAAQQLIERGDLRGAQLELRNTIKGNPQNAAAHFRLGQVELRLGDAVAAEKEFKFARDLGIDNRTLAPALAQAYMAQGRYRDLLRDFPTQGLPPEQAGPLLVQRAMAQLATNDVASAQTSATEAERSMPQSVDAALATAKIAVQRGDTVTAEQKIERALQINPRSTEALQLKGQLLNLKGDRVRALEVFDAAVAQNPNLLSARLERANILLFTGNNKRAKEDVDYVLKLEPRSALATYLQSVLLIRDNDYAGADAALTRLGAMLGRFPKGFYFQAVAKYNLGQGEQASDAANRYLAKNPDDLDAIKLFAKIELAARRTAKAIDALSKAADTGTPDAEMLDLLGRAYALSGRPQQALQSLERAVALAPSDAELITRLAAVRMSLGDSAGAAGDFERALAIAPNQVAAGENLVVAAISSGALDKAVVALERLRKVQGDSEMVGNLGALVKMAQLDLDGARDLLVGTIKRYPEATRSRINLGKVYVLQDKPIEAQKVLGELLDRDPINAGGLTSLVLLLLADGKLPQALARLEAAHAAAPADVDITIGLANLFIRAGNAKKGLSLVDDVLKEQPGNTALLNSKARTQVSLGLFKDAQNTYRTILDQTPSDVEVRRALADALASSNDVDGAQASLIEGLKLQPGNGALMQAYVGLVLKARGLDAALAAADTLAKDPGNLPSARYLRGDANMAAGRYADAAALYAAEMRIGPTQPLLLRLSAALNAAGRADQAAQVLREWMTSRPDDAPVAEALAALDIVARRFFDAESRLQVVLRQRPEDPGALNNLAWVYQQRGDPRALATGQKSYLINPTGQSADTLGWILVTSGNPTAGLSLLRQSLSQVNNDPTVQYHMAVALKDTGRKDEAKVVLQKILLGLLDFDDRPAAQKLYNDLLAGK